MAGYFGGAVDNVLMRITDAMLSLPAFLVLILLSAMMREQSMPFMEKNNVLSIALVIGLLSWMTTARLVRAIFLTQREMDYVRASQAPGASGYRITTRHILPTSMGPIIVEATLELGYAIVEESGLSFLGCGIQPPTPSWGNLLSDALGTSPNIRGWEYSPVYDLFYHHLSQLHWRWASRRLRPASLSAEGRGSLVHLIFLF